MCCDFVDGECGHTKGSSMRGDYGLYYGIECGKGWEKLYLPLIERVQAEGGELRQVKEKFGALRIYTAGISNELRDDISRAEHDSITVCEMCGEPGVLGNYGSFWIKTLCPTHQQERIVEFEAYRKKLKSNVENNPS